MLSSINIKNHRNLFALPIMGLAAACIMMLLTFRAPAQETNRANIILLTIDTTRADRISGYGYDRRTTPNLDALMKEGIRFENPITTITLTSPSFSAVMTSHFPHETGATRNGLPMVSKFPTLAELLKKEGYATGAVVSNWTLKNEISGLARGFDYYNEDFKSKRSPVLDEQDAKDVTDLALEWVSKQSSKKPFFAWVHYSDPHQPYIHREEFKFKTHEGEEKTHVSYRYDTEMAYTDKHIGRLLKGLEKMGLKKDTFILFTADHGESLGEHGYTGHGRRVYQQALFIPFAVIGPGIKKGVVANVGATLVDVLPTILTYIGAAVPGEARGKSVLSAGGAPISKKQTVRFFETYKGAVPAGAKNLLKGSKPMRIGMIDGKWKLIHSPSDDTRELYDLVADPGEMDDLSKTNLERTAVMTRKSWEWFYRTQPATPIPARSLPPDVRKRLEALGYIQN